MDVGGARSLAGDDEHDDANSQDRPDKEDDRTGGVGEQAEVDDVTDRDPGRCGHVADTSRV